MEMVFATAMEQTALAIQTDIRPLIAVLALTLCTTLAPTALLVLLIIITTPTASVRINKLE